MKRLYVFGRFRFDPEEYRLWRDGVPVMLAPKVVETLLVLVQNAGHLVEKDVLIKKVWPDAFVEEGNLNKNIFILRKTLGQLDDGLEYIETVPRRGYRFVVPVDQVTEAALTSPVRHPERVTGVERSPSAGTVKPFRFRWPLTAIAATVTVVAVGGVWRARFPIAVPKVLSITQITRDNHPKSGSLLVDKDRIYFSEVSDGHFVLAQMSVKNGEVTLIRTPLPNNLAISISPDGSQLLVASFTATEAEFALWVVPLPAGSPRRLADIMAHDGTWSADGRQLIYANGHDLYLAKSDGSEAHKLLTVPGDLFGANFSPDGRRIRFSLGEAASSSLWEANVDGTALHRLLPGWANPPLACCGHWTADGAYYFFQHTDDAGDNVWVLPRRSSWLRNSSSPVRLTSGPLAFSSASPAESANRVFVIGSQMRGELVAYDFHARQFVPFLGGIPAEMVDFSRDGKWITYSDIPNGVLWRARADGSDRLQLTSQPLRATFPHWSPDDKQIVFTSFAHVGKPSTLSLISAQGGSVQELLSASGTLNDPTWSRDGAQIAFAAETGETTEIRILDLRNHQVSTVQGSKGLFSPRWSPDGRYLAALSRDSGRLLLFDFRTQIWSSWLDDGHSVAFPTWSHDSKYVYFHRFFGIDSTYRRVKLQEHKSEQILSLKELRRYFSGYGFWSGIAPDGSPLFVRDTSIEEIYALELGF